MRSSGDFCSGTFGLFLWPFRLCFSLGFFQPNFAVSVLDFLRLNHPVNAFGVSRAELPGLFLRFNHTLYHVSSLLARLADTDALKYPKLPGIAFSGLPAAFTGLVDLYRHRNRNI